MNVLCLYHRDCSDGTGAAWVLSEYLTEQGLESGSVTYLATDYKDPPPNVRGKHVYILDFSYETEVLKELILKAESLTLLDHHPRTKDIAAEVNEWLQDRNVMPPPHVEYREDASGALMTWEHCFPGRPVPKIVQHISDRDLWRFELPETRAVMAALFTYPLKLSVWQELFREHRKGEDVAEFLLQPQALEDVAARMQMVNVAWAIEHTLRWVEFEGHRVPLINCPHGVTSDALHQLYHDVPFAMSYYDMPDGRKYSLRSRKPDGMDLRPLAMTYDGDGHHHAAGFVVPRHHPLASL